MILGASIVLGLCDYILIGVLVHWGIYEASKELYAETKRDVFFDVFAWPYALFMFLRHG